MNDRIKAFADFISKQINEEKLDPNSAEYHKAAFEYHAKKFLGHNYATNSARAEHDEGYMNHHEDREAGHKAAAEHHAEQYHKITGKKVEMVPREDADRDPMKLSSEHIEDKEHENDDDKKYLKEKKPANLGKTHYDELNKKK